MDRAVAEGAALTGLGRRQGQGGRRPSKIGAMAAAPIARRNVARRRVAVALVVAIALFAVQWLGQLHRAVHPSDTATTAAFAEPSAELVQALFGDHDRLHDCDAFDQASHADLAPTSPIDAALSMPPVPVSAWHAAWHVAAQARGFLARAPPSIS